MIKSRYLMSLATFLAVLWSTNSKAMLVGYADSYGIMGINSADHTELFLNYSLTSHFAVGSRFIRFDTTDGNKQFLIPEADFLVYRLNLPDSQGNIYAGGGYGAESFMNQTQGTAMGNFAMDWESRRLYFDFEFQSLLAADSRSYDNGKVRAGFAPYLAEYNELSTWLILQAESMPFVANSPFVTPMIRLFYKNVLVEAGADFQGNWMFNYMIHI